MAEDTSVPPRSAMPSDPIARMARSRHEFGEHGGVNLSIETSSTFTVLEAGKMPEMFGGRAGPKGGCFLYGRHFNPTVMVLSRLLAALEATPSAYCTASGMAAISGSLLQACDTGDHIVAGQALYGGTWALLHDYLPRKAGITTAFVDLSDLEAVARAFTPRTRVLYCETVSNPTLRVANLPALARIAHERGARLIVDNTFAPVAITPAAHGADVVIHSLTKFINGASDIVAGCVCADGAFIDQLYDLHVGNLMLLGPALEPRAAYEVATRTPSLGLRIREHARRGRPVERRSRHAGARLPVHGASAERRGFRLHGGEPRLQRHPDERERVEHLQRARRGVAACRRYQPGARALVGRLHRNTRGQARSTRARLPRCRRLTLLLRALPRTPGKSPGVSAGAVTSALTLLPLARERSRTGMPRSARASGTYS